MSVALTDAQPSSRGSAVRAVLREITWRRLLVAQSITFIWLALRYIDESYFPPRHLPSTFFLSGFVIDELTALSLLVAVYAGREAVLRGMRPIVAYLLPLVLAGVFVGIAQWYLRHWFGFQLLVDVLNLSTMKRKWFHMLYVALDTVIYGAFIMLVYVNHQYEVECVENTRQTELGRRRVERELTRARLADARARLDPQAVLNELDRVKTLYEADSPDAERALDDLASDLRRKLDSSSTFVPLA